MTRLAALKIAQRAFEAGYKAGFVDCASRNPQDADGALLLNVPILIIIVNEAFDGRT